MKEAHKKAAEVYPDGYTLTELAPADAFIRGDGHLNLEYKDMGNGSVWVELNCKVVMANLPPNGPTVDTLLYPSPEIERPTLRSAPQQK